MSFRSFNLRRCLRSDVMLTHPSLAGFLRRMLGLGEETSVGAPPTPPWACACTMVATGCVVLNVLVMGLATKLSAKTTPGPHKAGKGW